MIEQTGTLSPHPRRWGEGLFKRYF